MLTSSDDSEIEKISVRRLRLKGDCVGLLIPGIIRQISRGAAARFEKFVTSGSGMQIGQRAGRVTRDFRRHRGVAIRIGVKVTGDAAAWFLDTGTQEPAASLL
jgi:hypothetical protein